MFFQVFHERDGGVSEARFRITHRSGWISVDRTEVTLSIDQAVTHRPRLGHTDEGRVNDGFAVGMEVARSVARNFSALSMLSTGTQVKHAHGVKNAALGRF